MRIGEDKVVFMEGVKNDIKRKSLQGLLALETSEWRIRNFVDLIHTTNSSFILMRSELLKSIFACLY